MFVFPPPERGNETNEAGVIMMMTVIAIIVRFLMSSLEVFPAHLVFLVSAG